MFASLLGGTVVRVKVALCTNATAAAAEIRVLEVRRGTSSCLHSPFSAFVDLVESRFGLKIKSKLTYDDEGDTITVTTDTELEAALKSAGSSGSCLKVCVFPSLEEEGVQDDGDGGLQHLTAEPNGVLTDPPETPYRWLPPTVPLSVVDVHAGFRIKFSTCTWKKEKKKKKSVK